VFFFSAMSLSQGSITSVGSKGAGGGGSGKPPPDFAESDSPFLAKGKPKKKPTTVFGTNVIKVFHIVPREDLEGTGNTASAILVTCDGQFENKMVTVLHQIGRKPDFQAFVDRLNCFNMVLSLGPEGSPVLSKGIYPKKGVMWIQENNDHGPNVVQTGDQVRQFVMNCVLPQVKAINPVDERRTPVWNDETSCERVVSFAEVLNDFSIDLIVKRHFVEDNENFPLIHGNREFFQVSMKNLCSVHTEGNLTGAFKQLCCLTNNHMNPGDHCPVDNEGLLGEQDNLPNEQDQPQRPRVLAAEMAGEGGKNNAGINANEELAEDPIVDSDGKNVDRERPRQRRRLNDN